AGPRRHTRMARVAPGTTGANPAGVRLRADPWVWIRRGAGRAQHAQWSDVTSAGELQRGRRAGAAGHRGPDLAVVAPVHVAGWLPAVRSGGQWLGGRVGALVADRADIADRLTLGLTRLARTAVTRPERDARAT